MRIDDLRGIALSGATPRAAAAYERALAAFVSRRSAVDGLLDEAPREAPGMVMVHVLKACLLVGSRDPRRVRAAQPVLSTALALPANAHEKLHLAAIARVLADDHRGAAALLGDVLQAQPRDLLALAVACGLDYLTGDAESLRRRVESVLPAWSSDMPGYPSVRAMQAFGLVECGEYARAEEAALAALDLDPADPRAHHAMAHVFEMTDRPEAGVRWLQAHAGALGAQTVVSTHCNWHLALFHLASGNARAALDVYDRRIRAGRSGDVADLIDASALLWRLRLSGADTGDRWSELAAAWDPHAEDLFCSFSDMHAMLAFVGAHDWARARRLEAALARRALEPTRHGRSTRDIGLPACRGLVAFGRGDPALAITLLAGLPTRLHGLGGSHAQRDVLHLTLLHSIDGVRRPQRSTQHKKQDTRFGETRSPFLLPRLMST